MTKRIWKKLENQLKEKTSLVNEICVSETEETHRNKNSANGYVCTFLIIPGAKAFSESRQSIYF